LECLTIASSQVFSPYPNPYASETETEIIYDSETEQPVVDSSLHTNGNSDNDIINVSVHNANDASKATSNNNDYQSKPKSETESPSQIKSIFLQSIPLLLANIILLLIVFLFYSISSERVNKYEYKVIYFNHEGHERTGNGAGKFATITPSEISLNNQGDYGWELVSSYLELETAYPNFGDNNYVTGIQPNVRPQRLVCIFKRLLKKR